MVSGILYAGQPGTSDAQVEQVTAPEGGPFGVPVEIKSATVCNGTGGAVTLTIKVTQKSGAERLVYSALSVASGTTVVLAALVGLVLGDADSIHALASAGASLDLVISGAEVLEFKS